GESVFFNHADVESDMLPLAARIGKSEIDVLHVVVLDHLHDILGCSHGLHSPVIDGLTAKDAARGLDGVDSRFTGPDPDGFLDVGYEYLAVADPTSLGSAPDRLNRLVHHVVAE